MLHWTSYLAEGLRQSWRRVPAAGSPGVGGGVRCVPALASRRPPVDPTPRACSPRASAVLRSAPRTPYWFCAAAASQLRVLWKNTQTCGHTGTVLSQSRLCRLISQRGLTSYIWSIRVLVNRQTCDDKAPWKFCWRWQIHLETHEWRFKMSLHMVYWV